MNKTPWDYQLDVYNDVMCAIEHGERRIMIQLATRAGKSIIAAMLIEHFMNEPVYFIAHKTILVRQMSEELEENGIKHGIIAPWAPQLKYRVQVISKDTFYNRFATMKETGWKAPKLILVDEAHMTQGQRYKDILDAFPDSILIGMTATPCRLDGRPFTPMFTYLIEGPAMEVLQAKKRLCPIDTFVADFDDSGLHTRMGEFAKNEVNDRVDKPAVISELVKHWEHFAKGKKTLTFCASITHAVDVASQFSEAGYPSIALSSKNSAEELKRLLQDFYDGKYINLVSVDLFTMGFTVKDCECILQARPTQSLMQYLQMIGRGMVYLPGKTLINLDCVNNYQRFGLPDIERPWTLEGTSKKEKSPITLKKCPQCYRPVAISARECPHCGFLWAEREEMGVRAPKEKDGRMIKIERNNLVLQVARTARTYEQAVAIAGDKAPEIWYEMLKNKR